uniref:CHRD domain-containing protein n=2 Tax=Thermorudis TaxID=1649508 RepID=A0A7C3AL70_9BACT
MRRYMLAALPVALIAGLLAVTLLAGPALAQDSGVRLEATLTGAAEVPPGDPDGSGSATLVLNHGQGTLCFELFVENITLPATAAHVHVGPVGTAGPIVVPLAPPDASGRSSGCVPVVNPTGVDLIQAMIQHPGLFYVNVHTSDFPAGAVRGQLHR